MENPESHSEAPILNRPMANCCEMFCSAVMEAGIFEPDKDFGKAQFQEELNKWFENRGIITHLRSHLRHLMVTALQSTQVEAKPAPNGSSPKAQALNLIVAEYLFRHGCHYTLSVFTSEVPTLANFNPGMAVRGGRKRSDAGRKCSERVCFRDNEIDEIFNALGMSSREEELMYLKARYLEEGNEASLVELFLQAITEMSTKLQIRENLESMALEEGERFLSKKWSTKIADILLSEKMVPPQVAAVEEAIFRITEREIKRILEEERRLELQLLANREKRIQEHLKKHEDDILSRLTEAEKDLTARKGLIDEELIERQKHLTRIALEWSNKHEEILRLSKTFHNIENENRSLQRRLRELEGEKTKLETQEEAQIRTIDALREEMNSLASKLKEVTDSNVVLNERLQALIRRENKEVSVRHDEANQEMAGMSMDEIPLLWSRNMASDDVAPSNRITGDECEPRTKPKESHVKVQTTSPPGQRRPQFRGGDVESLGAGESKSNSSGDEEDFSLSPSSEEMIIRARKKLQDLEEETNKLNENYLEYKLKCISEDESSESSTDGVGKSAENVCDGAVIKETKCCQTVSEATLSKILKLEETKERKNDFEYFPAKKSEKSSPPMPPMRTPTKRQLQNREFFLKSRQMLHELENQNLEDLQETTPSFLESPTFSSGEELSPSLSKGNKKSPDKSVLLTPLRTASFYCNDNDFEPQKIPVESAKNKSMASSNKLPKDDKDCLALLEEARIKSPQVSARKSLRQQILLSESERETEEKNLSCQQSVLSPSDSPGKMSLEKKPGDDSFW